MTGRSSVLTQAPAVQWVPGGYSPMTASMLGEVAASVHRPLTKGQQTSIGAGRLAVHGRLSPFAGRSVGSMASAHRCRETLHRRAGVGRLLTRHAQRPLHVRLLGDLLDVLDLDAQAAGDAFKPPVPEQQLHGPQRYRRVPTEVSPQLHQGPLLATTAPTEKSS